MRHFIRIRKSEEGNILVIAIMILVVLSLLGMMAMNTTNTDILISGNLRRLKENFYISEAGSNREQREVGRGRYNVKNTELWDITIGRDDALNPTSQAGDIDENGNAQSDGDFDHGTPFGDYEFNLVYIHHFEPPETRRPFGAGEFDAFHYNVNVYSDPGESNVMVSARCWKIGSQ